MLESKFVKEKFGKFNYTKVKLNFQCIFHSLSAFRSSIPSTTVQQKVKESTTVKTYIKELWS